MQYKLYLGNQVYSSWSLRVWMLFRMFNIDFHYQVVPLYTPSFENYREQFFPVKTVPALELIGENKAALIWDSLAITEFLHEHHPTLEIWPAQPPKRAVARSHCAEMHSGFNALRTTMPMNLRRMYKNFEPKNAAQADIDRMESL